MADEKVNAAPEEEYNDDGSKNPEYVAPTIEGEGEPNTKKGEEAGGAGDDGFNDTIDPETPPAIPTRGDIASHIIARKNEKIKKLESKLKEEEPIVPDEDDDDDGLTLEAQTAIEKRVSKAIAPLLGKLASDADEQEMKTLLQTEPESGKYVNHIKAYMSHEAYKGIPPSVIYHHLAWQASQAIGAKKRAVADLEANQTRSGGRAIVDNKSSGDFPSAQEIEDMSDADFAKMEEDALRGKYKK